MSGSAEMSLHVLASQLQFLQEQVIARDKRIQQLEEKLEEARRDNVAKTLALAELERHAWYQKELLETQKSLWIAEAAVTQHKAKEAAERDFAAQQRTEEEVRGEVASGMKETPGTKRPRVAVAQLEKHACDLQKELLETQKSLLTTEAAVTSEIKAKEVIEIDVTVEQRTEEEVRGLQLKGGDRREVASEMKEKQGSKRPRDGESKAASSPCLGLASESEGLEEKKRSMAELKRVLREFKQQSPSTSDFQDFKKTLFDYLEHRK